MTNMHSLVIVLSAFALASANPGYDFGLHGFPAALPAPAIAPTYFKAPVFAPAPAPIFAHAPAPVFAPAPAHVFAPAPVFSHAPFIKAVAPAPIVKAVAPATSYATVTQVHVAHPAPAPIVKTIVAAPAPILKTFALPAPVSYGHGYPAFPSYH